MSSCMTGAWSSAWKRYRWPPASRLAGHTLQEANAGETAGALILALRSRDGTFLTNPAMHTPIEAGHVLIAIGTEQQLAALQHAAHRAGDLLTQPQVNQPATAPARNGTW